MSVFPCFQQHIYSQQINETYQRTICIQSILCLVYMFYNIHPLVWSLPLSTCIYTLLAYNNSKTILKYSLYDIYVKLLSNCVQFNYEDITTYILLYSNI